MQITFMSASVVRSSAPPPALVGHRALVLRDRPDAVRLEPVPLRGRERRAPAPRRPARGRAPRSPRRARACGRGGRAAGKPGCSSAAGGGRRGLRRPQRATGARAERLRVGVVRGGAAEVAVDHDRQLDGHVVDRRSPGWGGCRRSAAAASARGSRAPARRRPGRRPRRPRRRRARSSHADFHVSKARRRRAVRDVHHLAGLALAAVEQRVQPPLRGSSRPRRSPPRTRASRRA